jgi:hypothetical protein
MSKQSKLSPFEVGKLSKEKGLNENHCPYKSGSKNAKEWMKGFKQSGTVSDTVHVEQKEENTSSK